MRGGHIRVELPRDWVLDLGSIGHYLRYLPAGGVVLGAEVWAVLWVAWLSLPSTRIPTHDAVQGESLHPQPEGMGGRHIGVGLPACHVVVVSCRVGDHLSYLTACDVVTRTEGAVGVAGEDATLGEAGDELVEGVGGGHVRVDVGGAGCGRGSRWCHSGSA